MPPYPTRLLWAADVLSDLMSLLGRSAVLLLATTCFFWAVVGAAAARRTGRTRGTGAALGAVLPVIGPLVLLTKGPRDPRPATAAIAAQTAQPPRVDHGWGPPPAAATTTSQALVWGTPVAAPRSATVGGGITWGAGATPALTQPAQPEQPPQPTSVHVLPQTWPPSTTRDVSSAESLPLLLTAAAGCLLLLLSLLEPWLILNTPGIDVGAYYGGTSPATAVPVLLMVVLLAAAAVRYRQRPRGAWCVAGAAVGATALLTSLQMILVTSAVGSLLRHIHESIPARIDMRAGHGAIVLLLAGLCASAWSVAAVSTAPGTRGGA